MFGCYGEVDQPPHGNLTSQESERAREHDRFLSQKQVAYSQNDPFGVNLRLRQSLSNTNQILFKIDSERYISKMAETNKVHLKKPLTSLEQLKELNLYQSAGEEYFDENLFRDHGLPPN